MTALGVDIGSATMEAAVTTDRSALTLDVDHRTAVPATLAEEGGELHLAHPSEPVAVSDPMQALRTRTVATPGGHRFTFPTILAALLDPWTSQLPSQIGSAPHALVGVHPDWWPRSWRDLYRRALQQHAPSAETIPEVTAVAAGVDAHPGDTVAVWDFGKAHAAVTVLGRAGEGRGGTREVLDHAFTPDGGASGVDGHLCHALGWRVTPEALHEATRLRQQIATAGSNAEEVAVTGPSGPLTMTVREGIDMIALHIEQVVEAFRGRVEVRGAQHQIAVGGMSQDKGVQSALRQYGHLNVLDNPASALARGAALWGERR